MSKTNTEVKERLARDAERRTVVPGATLKADERVDHPKHYNMGKTEVIDVIKDQQTQERYEGFLQGQVLKYICRYPHKGDAVVDLKKARFYLNELIRVYEEPREDS